MTLRHLQTSTVMLALCLSWVAGCSAQRVAEVTLGVRSLPSPTPAVTPTPTLPLVLQSTDGSSEITLPPGWSTETALNSEAQIQASNRSEGLYLIVLSEPKDKLKDFTRDKHSQITRDLLTSNLTQSKVNGPTDVKQVNGDPAIQHEIDGSLNNIAVQFLHTTVETPTRFVQILIWMPPNAYDRNKPALQEIVQSFREK